MGIVIQKESQTYTRRYIHLTNELHTKIGHNGEYMMHATVKHLHYSIKGVLEVCEDWDMSKSKQKFLHKVEEEHDLNPGKMIYLDINSQKIPSYGGSKNWILIQDSEKKDSISSQRQNNI